MNKLTKEEKKTTNSNPQKKKKKKLQIQHRPRAILGPNIVYHGHVVFVGRHSDENEQALVN